MVEPGKDWALAAGDGPRYWSCLPLLALGWLRHGFSTRFDASGADQNMALQDGGDAGAAAERRARFLSMLNLDPGALVAAEQIHGTRVAAVGPAERGAGAYGHATAVPAADGLATETAGLVLSVYTADCAPVLLVDPVTRAVAAVHAGWRGAAAGIPREALAVMERVFSAAPARMLAAVGPAIGACCCEVGEETAAHIPPEARPLVVSRRPRGGIRLDLPGLVAWWLRAGGMAAERIFLCGQCTACRSGFYFSHRRGDGRTGRMMAVISRGQ